MVYSTRQFVVCLSVCHFVLVFFSPFSIAIIMAIYTYCRASAGLVYLLYCVTRDNLGSISCTVWLELIQTRSAVLYGMS